MRRLRRLIRRAKDFVQRGRRGYSDSDLWDFGPYIVGVLANGLRDFKESNIAHPCTLSESEWDDILETIAEGMASGRHANLDCNCRYNGGWRIENKLLQEHSKEHNEKLKKAFTLLGEWVLAIWW